ncbi:hypothetical protein FEM48_Zijuj10G0149000 [Ziziphus jujuba var. spinosa]|uniref:GDT1 family protein n=1 Tax=Ziziphus jujuba var. spinosa TaxID=714518 RepID=A0A978UP17_ZIZJJ|nr:hypothetical protein FEM48_Zijuj10G0149000 [Ziziphus jujuba var. spinosa]
MSSVVQGFSKSLAMTVLSEIGDKTFFAAAILAMRHPRRLVLSGCLLALIVMTILSVLVGWAAPSLPCGIWPKELSSAVESPEIVWSFLLVSQGNGLIILQHCCSSSLGYGLCGMPLPATGRLKNWQKLKQNWLDADIKNNKETTKQNSKDDDDLKKQRQPLLAQFLSPILLKAFSITFFGEWGDKSQLATIGLAADENPLGVVLGGIIGQALCTTAAVLGGKSLASQISEKIVALSGGLLFIVFGIQSFLSPFES